MRPGRTATLLSFVIATVLLFSAQSVFANNNQFEIKFDKGAIASLRRSDERIASWIVFIFLHKEEAIQEVTRINTNIRIPNRVLRETVHFSFNRRIVREWAGNV